MSYGTAGFRGPAHTLHAAVFRCGALAALRSVSLSRRAVGIMVTASHNPACDNGLKLVEPDGSMLDIQWERVATPFVNAMTDPLKCLQHLVHIEQDGLVVIGWDTRDSAAELVNLVKGGVEAAGGRVIELGCVTTPQLHFALRARDRAHPCDIPDYYQLLHVAYHKLVAKKDGKIPSIAVDCANGVGAAAMKTVASRLTRFKVLNCPGDGPLNDCCGADYVQKKRLMPTVYGPDVVSEVWASLDGDADRLVIYRERERGVELADGDRFATLVSSFVSALLKKAAIQLTVGVAQTAYSNGSATEFLQRLEGVDVVVAKTGVKHLERAIKDFDIGVYWEPNGHGTVLFADSALTAIKDELAKLGEDAAESEQRMSLDMLIAVSELANQAVGDGVADLLLVLAILAVEDMGFDDWIQMYNERYSWNLVVRVADKGVVETEDCDRLVKQPLKLRAAIASITAAEGCRAFVRPSGTEDVVRVYAETSAGCADRAKEMATEIGRAVYDFCGGIGERL